MIEFISQNIGTIVIMAVLLMIVSAAVFTIIRDKKKGKSPCGCSCSGCSGCHACHEKQR